MESTTGACVANVRFTAQLYITVRSVLAGGSAANGKALRGKPSAGPHVARFISRGRRALVINQELRRPDSLDTPLSS